jgi:hypothetical protein
VKNRHNYKLKHKLKDNRNYYIANYSEEDVPRIKMKYFVNTYKILKFWKKQSNRKQRANFKLYKSKKSYISDVKVSPIEKSIAWFVD